MRRLSLQIYCWQSFGKHSWCHCCLGTHIEVAIEPCPAGRKPTLQSRCPVMNERESFRSITSLSKKLLDWCSNYRSAGHRMHPGQVTEHLLQRFRLSHILFRQSSFLKSMTIGQQKHFTATCFFCSVASQVPLSVQRSASKFGYCDPRLLPKFNLWRRYFRTACSCSSSRRGNN